jgi:putative NADH-flavin reductase
MTKIAIIGATGPTGIHLAAELRKTDTVVRVVARGTDKLSRLFPDTAVEKWAADIFDADAPKRRCAQSRAATWCMTASGYLATRCICTR